MRNGRVETYMHSDSITEHKGAAMVKVTVVTDFAARTDIFKAFCHEAAKHAYAALGHTRRFLGDWSIVVRQYPHLEDQRLAVQRELHEAVQVTDVIILSL